MKLCYVAHAGNIHTRRWLGYFVRQGHEVFCLSDQPGTLDGVTVELLPNRDTLLAQGHEASKTDVVLARSAVIRDWVARHRPDIVHALYVYLRGWSAAHAGGRPLVITVLGNDMDLLPQYYRSTLHLTRDHLLNRFSLNQADLITAVSGILKDHVKAMVGHHVPVELIPLGVEVEQFQPQYGQLSLHSLRRNLEIPDNAVVILSPRIMAPLYRIETIVGAIPEVLRALPQAVFILKDTQPDNAERQEYVAQLHRQVADLGVTAAVRWVNEVPYESLPALYHAADMVVSVPVSDGMPVTLFEAMASQTPVIVGDLPAYDPIVLHQKTGWRVPLENPEALAQAIVQLAQSPGLARELNENAQIIVRTFGNYRFQMARMEALYEDLRAGRLPSHMTWHKRLNQVALDKMLHWF